MRIGISGTHGTGKTTLAQALCMNDALLELVYDDPLDAWGDIPVLELNGPLDARLDTVLTALNRARRARKDRSVHTLAA
jgi:molybdopterin-guanine dinucleotide biosynthesis protein